jgi:hypothetical protein
VWGHVLLMLMLILTRFVTQIFFFMSGSRTLMMNILQIEKIKFQKRRVGSCPHRVIELKLKMLF